MLFDKWLGNTTPVTRHRWYDLATGPLVICLLSLIAASDLFVAIAEDVAMGDPLTQLDLSVVQWFHARTYRAMTEWMRWVSDLHGVMAVSIYVSLLAIYLLWRRNWIWLVFLVSVVPVGMLLNETMKHLFQRSRPILDHALVTLPSYSFPSGHVAGATLFYGALAIMFTAAVDDWRKRAFIICAALTMVSLVAVSRLYLGVHYLSDTLAAFTEACAWLSLCVLGGQRYLKL